MKRALLINFGRMGDLLQTSPMIKLLKEQHPGLVIGMLAASNFREVMTGIPGIDYHHLLELLPLMKPLQGGRLDENYRRFRKLLQELRSYGYDTIFNLTHNRLGAVLSSMLGAEDIRGLSLNPEGYAVVEDFWLRQFYNTNINRGLNQFNLVDLYRLAGSFKSGMSTAENSRLRYDVPERAEKWAEAEIGGADNIIGIQVGASTDSKRWGEVNFRSLAEMLADDYTLLFFGTE